MRNLDTLMILFVDIFQNILKNNHEFLVTANNPDIIMARDNAIKNDITKRALLAFQEEFQRRVQEVMSE